MMSEHTMWLHKVSSSAHCVSCSLHRCHVASVSFLQLVSETNLCGEWARALCWGRSCDIAAVMPLKRTAEWAADRAATLQRRAFQLNYQSQAQEIREVLKSHPDCIPRLRTALVDMGYLPGGSSRAGKPMASQKAICDGSTAEPPTDGSSGRTPASAAGSGTDRLAPMSSSSLPAVPAAKGGSVSLPDPLPSKYKFFINRERPDESLSSPLLQYILSSVEKCLSTSALKALQPGPRRAILVGELQRLFEGMFDINDKAEIPVAWRNLATMVRELSKINEKNGRRARDWSLPTKWEDEGLFSLVASANSFFLEDTLKGSKVEVTHKLLQADSTTNLDELVLESNWSRSNAALLLKGGFRKWPVGELFSQAIANSAKAKAAMLRTRIVQKSSQKGTADKAGARSRKVVSSELGLSPAPPPAKAARK